METEARRIGTDSTCYDMSHEPAHNKPAEEFRSGSGRETQSFKVSVGQDKWINITGPSAFLTAMVILLLCVVGYLVNFNLKSWGDPFPIKGAFEIQQNKLDDHTVIMSTQHNEMLLAMRWNTYVLRYCSGNDTSRDARDRCSQIDLDRPEPESNMQRRYRVPH